MTWNIKSGHYQDQDTTEPVGTENLSSIAMVIKEAAPDVVCLQEVEKSTLRSRGINQSAWLCSRLTEMTGERWYEQFLAARHMHPGHFGNAILSRYPLHPLIRLSLANYQGRERRCFLLVEVDAQGTRLQVGTFHLGIRDEEIQAQAIKRCLSQWREPEHLLLGGDLNQEAGSNSYKTMLYNTPILRDAGPEAGCTFGCYNQPDSPRLDFWFYSLTLNLDQKGSRIIPVDISDHRPLLCRLYL